MYRNLGKLMAGTFLTKDINLPIDFPVFFWKYMCGEVLTFEDYKQGIDKDAEKLVANAVEMLGLDGGVDDLEDMYPGIATALEEVPTAEDAVRHYFVHNYDVPLNEIRAGMQSVIPGHVLQLIPWRDLKMAICGTPHVRADYLIGELQYEGGVPDNVQQWLQSVLKGFSNEERCLFLKFCSGQRRPPLHHKIKVAFKGQLQGLPTARTCGYLLELRQVSSEQQLATNLLTAIRGCQDFGFL